MYSRPEQPPTFQLLKGHPPLQCPKCGVQFVAKSANGNGQPAFDVQTAAGTRLVATTDSHLLGDSSTGDIIDLAGLEAVVAQITGPVGRGAGVQEMSRADGWIPPGTVGQPAEVSNHTASGGAPLGDAVVRQERRKSKSRANFWLQLAAPPVGLALGYLILCAIGPQYDFLGLMKKSDAAKTATTAKDDRQAAAAQPVWAPFEKPRAAARAQPDKFSPTIASAAPEIKEPKKDDAAEPPAASASAAAHDDEKSNTSSKMADASDPAQSVGPAANGLIGDGVPKTPPQRLPVPEADAQAKAAKEIADIYASDIKAANKSKEKAALAKQFVTVAAQTNDDPAGRYMLLEDARKMAIEAGAARMVCDAIDQLAKSYDVDRDALNLSSLDLAARTAASQDQSRELIRVSLERTDEALGGNEFDLAIKFGEFARAAAAKLDDKPQVVSISQKLSAIEDTGKQYAPAQTALKTLAETPDDPQANLTAGRFFCFVKGDWPTGLVYLAKSNDAALRRWPNKICTRRPMPNRI